MQSSVVNDVSLVARIARCLCSGDLRSAALVCHVWSEAVRWAARKIAIRHRHLLPQLLNRFRHIEELDLAFCLDALNDSDLQLVRGNLQTLKIGCLLREQVLVTSRGLADMAATCGSNLRSLSLACPKLGDDGIRVLTMCCKDMRSISLESCNGLTDAALELLPAWSNLERLALVGNVSFTPRGLTSIGGCKDLLSVKLDLGYLDIDPCLKSIVSGCTKMEELNLKFKDSTLGDLIGCTTFTTLKSISVDTDQRLPLDIPMLSIASHCTSLMEVSFRSTYFPLEESTAVFIILKHSHHLRKLHLEVPFLSSSTLVMCKSLEYLYLNGYQASDRGFFGNYGLKYLALKSAKELQDVDVQTLLDGKTQLEHLSFHNCTRLTSIGLSSISCCKLLQQLDLGFTAIDDLGLGQIAAGVKNLKSLSLIKCEGISSIWPLTLFPKLETLSLEQCSFVTDDGLNVLAKGCSKLRSLSLDFTRITDAGLLWLTNCRELRYLSVPYCLGIQGNGVLAISRFCEWFQHVILSHRLRKVEAIQSLTTRCQVLFVVDDMSLIPFEA